MSAQSYYCHACDQEVRLSGPRLTCPICSSDFLEALGSQLSTSDPGETGDDLAEASHGPPREQSQVAPSPLWGLLEPILETALQDAFQPEQEAPQSATFVRMQVSRSPSQGARVYLSSPTTVPLPTSPVQGPTSSSPRGVGTSPLIEVIQQVLSTPFVRDMLGQVASRLGPTPSQPPRTQGDPPPQGNPSVPSESSGEDQGHVPHQEASGPRDQGQEPSQEPPQPTWRNLGPFQFYFAPIRETGTGHEADPSGLLLQMLRDLTHPGEPGQPLQTPPFLRPIMDILSSLLPGNLGDYVTDERTFDNIITQLMEQESLRRGPLPVPESVLATLPRRQLVPEDPELSHECAICKDTFVLGEGVLTIPCGHTYHEECILPWLRKSASCPMCRASVGSSTSPAREGDPSGGSGGEASAPSSGPTSTPPTAPPSAPSTSESVPDPESIPRPAFTLPQRRAFVSEEGEGDEARLGTPPQHYFS